MTRSSLIASTALTLCLFTVGAYAEDGANIKGHKSFTTEDGRTVDVVRGARRNDDGDAVAGRAYRVTDENGDVIAGGVDKAYRTDEGAKGVSRKRMRTNEDGATVVRGRTASTDGEGDVRVRRGYRVTDQNGDVVRAARHCDVRASDGRRAHSDTRVHRASDAGRI